MTSARAEHPARRLSSEYGVTPAGVGPGQPVQLQNHAPHPDGERHAAVQDDGEPDLLPWDRMLLQVAEESGHRW
jgi:hypothetical protein